jgi:choline dehydrogenase-like flavoprotein
MAEPRVLLIGYSGANNTGAEALLLADIADVRAVFGPAAPITIPALDPANLRRYVRDEPNVRIERLPTIFFRAVRGSCGNRISSCSSRAAPTWTRGPRRCSGTSSGPRGAPRFTAHRASPTPSTPGSSARPTSARELLERIGINPASTFEGILNGGHPGGTLPLTPSTAISLHDDRLPENVYVADSSLFPRSLGLPPILTIVALAKRIARLVRDGAQLQPHSGASFRLPAGPVIA